MASDDFASLFESPSSQSSTRKTPHLDVGQKVEGTVLAISAGLVVVDIGGSADATLELTEFDDRPIAVGDRIVATVAEARKDGPRLTRSLGRGGTQVKAEVLRQASESGTPVSGTITAAVKGGLAVEVAGVRGFCPISQADISYVSEPESLVGNTFDFLVIEFKEGGRNIVLSRRKLLEARQKEAQESLAKELRVGSVVEGTVKSIIKSGVLVDLGGLDGYVHISELSSTRVDNPEDVVRIGESVSAQVLSIQPSERGLSVRLSLKALSNATAPQTPQADEVLAAKVTRHVGNGVIVSTSHGEGLIPTRELSLPPGADHRRTYPVGHELEVVLDLKDGRSGRLRFSVERVQQVQERKNFHDFGGSSGAGSLGSLGELMKQKLTNLPEPSVTPTTKQPSAPTQPAASAQPAPAPPAASNPPTQPLSRKAPPVGVTKRKR